MLAGCSPSQNIQFLGYRSIGILGTNLDSAMIRMKMICYNPNHIGVTVRDGWMDIYAGKTLLGRLIQDASVHIPARDTFNFPMRIKVSLSTLMQYSSHIRLNDSVLFRGSGECRIGKSGFFIHRPIHMQESALLNLY